MRWPDGIIGSTDASFSELQETGRIEKPGVLQSMKLKTVGNLATEQ